MEAEEPDEKADPEEKIANLRRTACEQGLFYRDNREQLADRYSGSFIYLREGEVVWSGDDPQQAGGIPQLAGEKKDQALFLKLADPDEKEGEHTEVYEKILAA